MNEWTYIKKNIYYLNMKELRLVTKKFGIPIDILVEKMMERHL